MRKIKSKWLLWLSLAIVLIVTLIPGNGKIAGNYLDKLVHFTIFAFLGFSVIKAFSQSKKLTLYLMLCILLGFVTEIVQQYIPGRNLDFYDALADTLGVFSAYLFTQLKID